jgi:L-fuconolactonase
MRIDSHQNFWHYNTSEFDWIDGKKGVLKKDFLPKELKTELDNIGFDGSITVQARQRHEETDWLLKLAEKYDFIKGVVGWVDLSSPSVEEYLTAFSQRKKLVGLRHNIKDEPDEDFILGDKFQRGISCLKNFQLTYDILIYPNQLANAIKFANMFPDQVFVLDHMANPNIKDKKLVPWKDQIKELAQNNKVYCKLSGMVSENHWDQWDKADFIPFLDVVFEAFGIDRLMIGSDWPTCRVEGSYQEVMDIVMNYFKEFSKEEKDKVFGLNALKAYNINNHLG